MVKAQMRAKDDAHCPMLKWERKTGKRSLLEEMMGEEQVNMKAKCERLVEKEKIEEAES